MRGSVYYSGVFGNKVGRLSKREQEKIWQGGVSHGLGNI